VPLDPARAAMALGDDLVFLEELFSHLAEELFRFEKAGAILAAQLQIPILGNLPGEGEALLLGAGAALLAADRGRALPEAAVVIGSAILPRSGL